jgi:hypothetical protein
MCGRFDTPGETLSAAPEPSAATWVNTPGNCSSRFLRRLFPIPLVDKIWSRSKGIFHNIEIIFASIIRRARCGYTNASLVKNILFKIISEKLLNFISKTFSFK